MRSSILLAAATAGLVGRQFSTARARRSAGYFSPVSARWRVGPDFYQRAGRLDAHRRPTGLVDSLDVFARRDFDTRRVDPAVRAFYEETADHILTVTPTWSRGVREAYAAYGLFAHSWGQTDFPASRDAGPVDVASGVIAVRGDSGLRAWVRTYASDPSRSMYVAEYSTHRDDHDVATMDIAFPFPGGNLASILRPDPLPAGGSDGILLTTESGPWSSSDAGIFFVTPRFALRLPLSERLWVWPAHAEGIPADLTARRGHQTTVLARHELCAAGIRYLLLDYAIARTAE